MERAADVGRAPDEPCKRIGPGGIFQYTVPIANQQGIVLCFDKEYRVIDPNRVPADNRSDGLQNITIVSLDAAGGGDPGKSSRVGNHPGDRIVGQSLFVVDRLYGTSFFISRKSRLRLGPQPED